MTSPALPGPPPECQRLADLACTAVDLGVDRIVFAQLMVEDDTGLFLLDALVRVKGDRSRYHLTRIPPELSPCQA